MVSDYDGSYKRHCLLLSISRFHARHWSRDYLVISVGGCDLCALPASARRTLALDLRRHSCDRSLFQCFRRRRAVIRKNTSVACSRSDTDRAAIQIYATRCSGDFRSPRDRCGNTVPPSSNLRGFIADALNELSVGILLRG